MMSINGENPETFWRLGKGVIGGNFKKCAVLNER